MELMDPSGSPVKISDAHIWVNCPGSILMQRKYPPIVTDSQNISRAEGKAAHQLAQWMLTAGIWEFPAMIDTMSEFGVAFTEEIHGAASIYARDVLTACAAAGKSTPDGLECRVNINELTQGAYGYCDAWLWDEKTFTLTVWEAKFGRRFVSEFDNWQMILYTWGILSSLNVNNGLTDQVITVNHRVVQPRCFDSSGPVRQASMKASDLRGQFNVAHAAIRERDPVKNVPVCKPGPWCGDCTARYACDALSRAVSAIYQYVTIAHGGVSDGSDLSLELRILEDAEELVKARKSAIEARAESLILSGDNIPGYSVESTRGRLRWKPEHSLKELAALGDMFGVKILKDPEPITPTQAKQKGVDESVIQAYSENSSTGKKLVKIKGDKFRRIFQNLKG